jgi:hypothetical protein
LAFDNKIDNIHDYIHKIKHLTDVMAM